MSGLDMRSVVFTGSIMELVCALVVVGLWRQNRTRFEGLHLLAMDFVLQAAGLWMIMLRGLIPDWISIVLANSLIVGGALLGLVGLEMLVGKKGRHVHNLLLVAGYVALLIHLVAIRAPVPMRSLLSAATLLALTLQYTWLLLFRVDAPLRPLTRWAGLVFAAYSLLFALRVPQLLLISYRKDDFMQAGLVEALFVVTFQVMFVLMTYALSLMVNKFLLADLASQEEIFSRSFHAASHAILITRLSDGKMIEVNQGFTTMTGYSSAESVGRTTSELNLWERPGDRALVLDRLAREGKIENAAVNFRRKSGELFPSLYSAAIIQIRGERCLLSSVTDITEHTREAKERERLLAEREKALSEIRVLSGLLPICSCCKKIRDDKGYWSQIESYIHSHSEAQFTHGICPDCAKKVYPDLTGPEKA